MRRLQMNFAGSPAFRLRGEPLNDLSAHARFSSITAIAAPATGLPMGRSRRKGLTAAAVEIACADRGFRRAVGIVNLRFVRMAGVFLLGRHNSAPLSFSIKRLRFTRKSGFTGTYAPPGFSTARIAAAVKAPYSIMMPITGAFLGKRLMISSVRRFSSP